MLPAEDIQSGLAGAWALMLGRPDGLKRLDLSADGFWNSFFAIPVALPALVLSWVALADTVASGNAARVGLILRFAAVDIGAWVLPLLALALVARRAGIADRFAHYVVATNWGSVIAVWLMVPSAILQVVLPAAADLTDIVSLTLFVASMVLTWRLTNIVIAKGAAAGTAVFAGMFAASLIVLSLLQSLLGLSSPG